MKKKGFIEKLVAASVTIASLLGTLYLLKDKLSEHPTYKEFFSKWENKLKSFFSSELTPDNFDSMDDIMDDFEDVDDLDEILHETDKKRGYVTIKLHQEEEA